MSKTAPELGGGIIGRLRPSRFRDSILVGCERIALVRDHPVVLVECF